MFKVVHRESDLPKIAKPVGDSFVVRCANLDGDLKEERPPQQEYLEMRAEQLQADFLLVEGPNRYRGDIIDARAQFYIAPGMRIYAPALKNLKAPDGRPNIFAPAQEA